MKKAIVLLLSFCIVVSCGFTSYASSYEEALEKARASEAAEYENFLNDEFERANQGKSYDESYKKGWIAAYKYASDKHNEQNNEQNEKSETANQQSMGQIDGKLDGYKAGYAAGLNVFSSKIEATEDDFDYKHFDEFYKISYEKNFKEQFSNGYSDSHKVGIEIMIYRAALALLFIAFLIVLFVFIKSKNRAKESQKQQVKKTLKNDKLPDESSFDTLIDKLEKLDELQKNGTLTDEEFTKLKKDVIEN